ncbi:ATP-binding protein [Streptomyces sp. NPDC091292]|uniref:sensor histidine kinase n=1 Tax=Streptomyces sp. NPDC091292 TaxID=3365991 RepID=UPI003815548C
MFRGRLSAVLARFRVRRWLRLPPASLRTTFAVSFAAVAAAVTLLVGFLSYDAAARLVRVDQQTVFDGVVQDLRQQVVQNSLNSQDFTTTDPDHDGPRDELFRPARTDVQILGPAGRVADKGNPELPVGERERSVANAREAGVTVRGNAEAGDGQYRLATVSLGDGRGAVQVAQELSDTEDLLQTLQQRTLLFALAVVLAAGIVGWWLARRITERLVRLTGVAEDVARTGILDARVPVAGRDEVGRLGRSFDRMLGRLARSEEDQRRLVQDAGHELRTPLTSLRTNISLLRRIEELPPAARDELVADLAQESLELTDLVNELVDLAAGQQDDEPPEEVALGDIAQDVAALARRRTGRTVTVSAGPSGGPVVFGRPAALQRALSNLVENAAKFDRDGTAPIEIVVTADARGGGRVEVRDRGPGIADSDLAHVFDRFYRAADARSLPGSGLGLSIVQDVATAHGGRAFASPREGGGATIGFTVPPPDASRD